MTGKEDIAKAKERIAEACACKACILPDRETSAVQEYLVEVVGRLFDTQHALEAVQRHAQGEKYKLLQEGKSFVYQQAMIDIATEIYRYATGEDNLQEVMDKLVEDQRKVRKQMQGGMEVI